MNRAALQRFAPLLATVATCAALYVTAGALYDGFFSWRVLSSFFGDNAFLGIAAVGMTFVILSGGIDLSVGAVIGCTSIVIATLVRHAGWHPAPAMLAAVAGGTLFGAAMGGLIQAYRLPAFIVTLAGMFFARGLGFVIHQEALSIEHGFLDALHEAPADLLRNVGMNAEAAVRLGGHFPTTAVVFLLVLAAGMVVAHLSRFGRNVYAIGGSEESALLMGLPVGRTRIGVYAISGFCSAVAGCVYMLYTFSGNPNAGTMLELDAIAAVVIGGTLLSGGVGTVAGTLLGVLIFGIIQTAIIFDGRLSSWWTRIAIGALLLGFILLQRFMQRSLVRDVGGD